MNYKLTKYSYGKLVRYTAYMLTPARASARNPIKHFATPKCAKEFLESKGLDPSKFDWTPLKGTK